MRFLFRFLWVDLSSATERRDSVLLIITDLQNLLFFSSAQGQYVLTLLALRHRNVVGRTAAAHLLNYGDI